MLTAMQKTLTTFQEEAERVRFNYNRINKKKKITWGTINAK